MTITVTPAQSLSLTVEGAGTSTTLQVQQAPTLSLALSVGQGPAGTGSGDMLASVYDPDGDGKVVAAVSADMVTLEGVAGLSDALAAKQATLVSGTNIKTVNGASLVGSGDLAINKVDVGLGNVDNTSDANKPVSTATQTALDTKQATLVSGTNIKTVNGVSVLGSGDLTVGSAALSVSNKTAAYAVVAADNGAVIRITAGTGDITLPSCAAVGVGFNCTVVNHTYATRVINRVGSDAFQDSSGGYSVAPGVAVQLAVLDASSTGKWQALCASTNGMTPYYGTQLGQFARASADRATAINGTASGVQSTAVGYGPTASGTDSLAVGSGAQAQGTYCAALGYSVTVSGANAVGLGSNVTSQGSGSIALGYSSLASANYAAALGYYAKAAQTGKYAFAGTTFGVQGDAQYGVLQLRASTTGSTVVMTSDAGAASTANQLIVATGQCMAFTGTLIGKQSGSAAIAAYEIKGTLVNNGGTVTMPSGTLTLIGTDGIGLTTAPTLAADNTNKGLALTSGAKTATNIRWLATLHSTELTY